MTISEIIIELERIKQTSGDLDVVTNEYDGGDYELRDALCVETRDHPQAFKPVVIIGGGIRY